MKLRLRSVESGRTTRVDIPTPSTAMQLKLAVAEKLSVSPLSLRLSLNKKNELGDGLPTDAPFASLAITSGDLIFYQVLDRSAVSSRSAVASNPSCEEALILPGPVAVEDGGARRGLCSSSDSGGAHLNASHVGASVAGGEGNPFPEGTSASSECVEMDIDGPRAIASLLDMDDAHVSPTPAMASIDRVHAGKPTAKGVLQMDDCPACERVSSSGHDRSAAMVGAGNYEFDGASCGAGSGPRSIFGFLFNVFSEARNVRRELDFLVFAIHAIMLESGFLGFDKEKKRCLERFRLPDDWVSESTVSLSYTVRDLLVPNDAVNVVVLKVEFFPGSLVVYGRLNRELHRIYLEFSRYVPSICAMVQQTYRPAYTGRCHHQRMVSELWREVKDKVVLPLLHELCEISRLPPPACLGCLPAEMKVKILKYLPPLDLAKIGCVSKEYRDLSSNNVIWRKKYVEEFGPTDVGECDWKQRFAQSWRLRKNCISPSRLFYSIPSVIGFTRPPIRQSIVGGDYDRVPFPSRHTFGSASLPFGANGRGLGFQTGRRIGHHICDLGR
ncbi:F-box protein SKIP22-like [Nymphaea colorata]|nr:F-box protein SKIP22-like [Nymphaea colorata]